MTRLVTDHSLAASAVFVPCLRDDCKGKHRMVLLCDAVIDLDGPAFRAYYHAECAPQGWPEACKVDGCTRSHSWTRG